LVALRPPATLVQRPGHFLALQPFLVAARAPNLSASLRSEVEVGGAGGGLFTLLAVAATPLVALPLGLVLVLPLAGTGLAARLLSALLLLTGGLRLLRSLRGVLGLPSPTSTTAAAARATTTLGRLLARIGIRLCGGLFLGLLFGLLAGFVRAAPAA